MTNGPHQDQPLRTAGAPIEEADAAVIILHGRGASARSILQMTAEFDTDRVAYLAPQAFRSSWYPSSFLAPVDRNEPGRSSGLRAIEEAIGKANDGGVATESILVMGFPRGRVCRASTSLATRVGTADWRSSAAD